MTAFTREELEASAERVCEQVAELIKAGNLACWRRMDEAVGDGLLAAQKVLASGEGIERARIAFSFARDAALAEAVQLLPVHHLDSAEFDKMPVLRLSDDDPTLLSKRSRCEIAGQWVIFWDSELGTGNVVLFRPDIEDFAPRHN
jgi:hypothetical protein